MANNYKIGIGHDVALASLVLFSPQPHCPGLFYTRSMPMADRSTNNEGAYFPFFWNALPLATYLAILTQANLDALEEAEVTVYGPSRRYDTLIRYNAIARLPLVGQEIEYSRSRVRDISILFTDLEEL